MVAYAFWGLCLRYKKIRSRLQLKLYFSFFGWNEEKINVQVFIGALLMSFYKIYFGFLTFYRNIEVWETQNNRSEES